MGIKIVTKNKRAGFDYHLGEKFEAGLVLTGTEVKSIRIGKVSINEAYIAVSEAGEAFIYNMSIPPYPFGNIHNHEEKRVRKLLLHNLEISKIFMSQKTDGITIIPTSLYFKDSFIKIELALGKGKKLHDKRQDIAKKDVERKLKRGNYE